MQGSSFKKYKDRSICSNREKLTKCSICKNCKDKDNCDIYYISSCCKAILNIGRSPQTGKEIMKTFYNIGMQMEDIKKSKCKIGTNKIMECLQEFMIMPKKIIEFNNRPEEKLWTVIDMETITVWYLHQYYDF